MSDASKYDLLRHLRLSADISVPTLADLYALQTFRRKWGVSVYVYEDGANTGTYRLVKGHNSDNPQDNLNWVKDVSGNSEGFWEDESIGLIQPKGEGEILYDGVITVGVEGEEPYLYYGFKSENAPEPEVPMGDLQPPTYLSDEVLGFAWIEVEEDVWLFAIIIDPEELFIYDDLTLVIGGITIEPTIYMEGYPYMWVYEGVLPDEFTTLSSEITLKIAQNFLRPKVHVRHIEGLEETDPVAMAAIGDRTYTEQNYITDGETISESLDSLDQALKIIEACCSDDDDSSGGGYEPIIELVSEDNTGHPVTTDTVLRISINGVLYEINAKTVV
jgi:hypothetical protein